MRVLHIAQSLIGGLGSYIEEIAGYQSDQLGPENVRFLVPKGNRQHIPSVRPAQIVEFEPSGRTTRGLLALGIASRRQVAAFQPKIVHLHSTFAGAIARTALGIGRSTQIVYCPHGWSFAIEAPWWKKCTYALIERSFLPLTDAVVNISASDYNCAIQYGFQPKKLVLVRNGISRSAPKTKSRLHAVDTSGLQLIFVGRHDRQKGLDHLLEAFELVSRSDLHLHVIGAAVVSKPISEPDASKDARIHFHGWKTRHEVQTMISRSDAVVMPSRWEGFGLVALEAMRLGKAVIASRRGALPELVDHNRTGLLFALEDPNELAQLLNGLDQNSLAEMGRAAHASFLQHFTSDQMNSTLIALYRDLA